MARIILDAHPPGAYEDDVLQTLRKDLRDVAEQSDSTAVVDVSLEYELGGYAILCRPPHNIEPDPCTEVLVKACERIVDLFLWRTTTETVH